jgi:LEA14-like dessication related protein
MNAAPISLLPLRERSAPMRRAALVSVVALFFCAGALSGCAGLGRPLESPRISLSNIEGLESSGMESALRVHLRVQNPNEVDLDIRGVECEVEINGKPFAYGMSSTPVRIPAFGSDTVPVKVYTSVIDIFRGLLSLQGRDDLSYRVKGKMRLSGAGFIPSSLPFDSQGSISIKDLSVGKRGPS